MPNEIRTSWSSFPWYDNWIWDAEGNVLRRAQYPWIKINHLSELGLQAVGTNTYQFRNPLGHDMPRYRTTVQRLAEWVQIIIADWAALPSEPVVHETNRVFAASRHPVFDRYRWTMPSTDRIVGQRPMDGEIHATIPELTQPINFQGGTATDQARADLSTLQKVMIILDGHPNYHHGPTLRGGGGAHTYRKRASLSTLLYVQASCPLPRGVGETGHQTRTASRSAPSFWHSSSVGCGISRSGTTMGEGVSSQQQFFRYRLTIGALNLRDQEVRHTHTTSTTTRHMMRSTSFGRVQELRRSGSVSTAGGANSRRRQQMRPDVFEPSPALLAVHTRRRLQELTNNDDVITKIVRRAWQVIRYMAQQLWLTRNDSLFQEHRLNRSEHLETIQAATRRQLDAPGTGLRLRVKTRTQGMAVDIILEALHVDAPHDQMSTDEVRLYFDGGSR